VRYKKAMYRTALTLSLLMCAVSASAQSADDWQSSFSVDKSKLGVNGANPYFKLTPGYVLRFAHGKDTDTLTVLKETKTIDGVECRVVEDRELKNGKLLELTRDYYAIDAATNDVYYMGEEVDVYKDGKVVNHEGSWLSGEKGAKFGMMLPGSPKVGQRFYSEQAPGVAMDRMEVVSVTERASTPAGAFEKCVHVVETSALEKGMKDHKVYCPGVGLVKDAEMTLVKYGAK